MAKILVTGAFGEIGSELVPALQAKFGRDNVIAIAHKNVPQGFDGIVELGDATKREDLERIIRQYQIDTLYHLVSLLSATGEANPDLAFDVNLVGLKLVLDLAKQYQLKLFWPSSIAAFGPTTPRINTPQQTILEPTTIYGVTKVAGELLCLYYFKKFGLDVRSVRYPGIISWKTPPGGGTTDYAVAIYYDALQSGTYTCFVKETTTLPMMYMDDAVRATIRLMETPADKLTVRTSYNLAAMSFTVTELAENINHYLPVNVTYAPDHRQTIADSWPQSIDDSVARQDWGWVPEFDLDRMTQEMIKNLKIKLGK